MRKLIMWNLITLDGYFEGSKPWDLEFHSTVWGDELEQYVIEQSKSIGTLLFGRATYEGMAAYWTTVEGEAEVARFMNSVPKIVVSTTLTGADWNNSRLISSNAAEEVRKLKQQDGKDIYIFGSAKLSSSLMEHGLIDEYRIGLTPVILGAGTPLFKSMSEKMNLQLIDTRQMDKGFIILRYQPKR